MIIPMKKAKIAVLKEDQQALLESLQRYGCLMLIEDDDTMSVEEAKDEQNWILKAEKSLKLLKKHQEKKPFIRELYQIDYDDFIAINTESKYTKSHRSY